MAKFLTAQQLHYEMIWMLRGAILKQCEILHPNKTYRSTLLPLLEDSDLTVHDLDLSLEWLRAKNWITIAAPAMIIGRKDRAISMTADGIDAALQVCNNTLTIPTELRNG